MTIATDLGVLTPPVHEALSGCDLVALESNYDLHMLRSGPYPYYLRARIESTRGPPFQRRVLGKAAGTHSGRVQKVCAVPSFAGEQHACACPADRVQHAGRGGRCAGEGLHRAGTAPQRNESGIRVLNKTKRQLQMHCVCFIQLLSVCGCHRLQKGRGQRQKGGWKFFRYTAFPAEHRQ